MIKVGTYLDGGTVYISDGVDTFYIDNRIGTDTKHILYNEYPDRGEIVYEKRDFECFLNMVDNLMLEMPYITENEFERIKAAREIIPYERCN